MSTAPWDRVAALFDACLDLDSDQRAARLRAENDAAVAAEVEELLTAADASRHLFASRTREDFERTVDATCGDLGEAERAAVRRLAAQLERRARPLDAFRRVGAFELVRKLGEGGMGVVYEAHDTDLDRPVAVKLVRSELLHFAGSRERFRTEVAAVARLRHPGIVQVYSAGEHDGMPYYAMELVNGRVLSAVLGGLGDREPSTRTGRDLIEDVVGDDPVDASASGARSELTDATWVDAGVRITRDVADALAHAHTAGVLHRDIKPSNVMLDLRGRPRLLDFGLARADGVADGLTATGAVLGSLASMAPEQVLGRGDLVDERTDVYAVGVLLYEVLCGRSPFRVLNDPVATRERILGGDYAPLRKLNRRVPEDVALVCAKAMAIEREQRYASMAEFVGDLDNLLARRPIRARRPGPILRLRRAVQRNPAIALAAIVAFVLLGVGASLLAAFEGDARRRSDALRELAMRNGYRSSLLAGQGLLEDGDIRLARQQLQSAPDSFRRWEWRHLARAVDTSLTTIEPFDGAWLSGLSPCLAIDATRHLVAGSADGRLVRLDIQTGAVLGSWRIDGPANEIAPLDSTRFVCAGVVETAPGAPIETAVRLVELGADAAEERVLLHADGRINGIDAGGGDLADRRVVAAAVFGYQRGQAGGLVVVRADGEATRVPTPSSRGLTAVAVDADGRRIFGGSTEGRIYVWSVDALDAEPRLVPVGDGARGTMVTSLDVGPDGRRLAATVDRGAAYVLEVATGRLLGQLAGVNAPIRWLPDGSGLLASHRRTAIARIAVEDRGGDVELTVRAVARGHLSTIEFLATSAAGREVVSWATDGTLRRWDLDRFESSTVVGRHGGAVNAIDLGGGDEPVVLSGGSDQRFAVQDLATGRVLVERTFDGVRVESVAVRTGVADRYAIGGRPAFLALLGGDGSLDRRLDTAGADHVFAVAWSADGEWFLSGDSSGRLRRWSADGELLDSLEVGEGAGGVCALAIHPDGRSVLTGSESGALYEHRLPRLDESTQLHEGGEMTFAVAWVPTASGSYDVVSGDLRRLRFGRRRPDGRFEFEGRATDEPVSALAVVPHERRILAGTMRGKVQVWDAVRREHLLTFRRHTKGILEMCYDAAADRLVTASWDGTVRSWGRRERLDDRSRSPRR